MRNARIPAALVAALILHAPAEARATLPDRASLSYEDNVTINTACFGASAKGNSAYEDCVAHQLAAVKDHPAPDRTGLTSAGNHKLEEDCAYLRRAGLAQYNDCLAKGVADAPAAEPSDDDSMRSTAVLAKAVTGIAPAAVPVSAAAALPRPSKVLPARPAHIERQALSPAQLYKKIERSVFVVGAARSLGDAKARDIVQGSAIAIGEHLLLTNCHVVKDRPLIVILQDHYSTRAKLVAEDDSADRCVIESSGGTLAPVGGVRPFGDLTVGERVFAIGAPSGLERTLTEGLVSGLRSIPGRNVIQTSAPISPGSSGGGLFDERGNLIGVTTAQIRNAQLLDFAIAASDFWE